MTDVLEHSVTKNDYADNPRGGVFLLQSFGWSSPDAWGLPPTPPHYWSPRRDAVLRSTLFAEDMWAGAIYKAITKNVALGWEIKDSEDSTRRVNQSQDLYLFADGGKGWVHFASRHLGDFLLSDNGAFVEVERASNARGAKIVGLNHLDSSRCMRTGDLEIPVIYTDLKDREHELKWYQVLCFSDMPMSGASYHGVGMCAASRAYKTIYKLAGLENYSTEKITGNRANAIALISGITQQQLEDAIVTHTAETRRQGFTNYKGSILIPTINPTSPPSVSTIDLAGIPDGFTAKEERDNGYVKYANAIGMPVQDIQPLSGQGLGTGAQTVVLSEEGGLIGTAAWRKQWEHNQNEHVLSAATTFTFGINDIRDKKAKAEVQKLRADTRTTMITDLTITPDQARQMAADDGDIPKEFLAEDQTPGGTLTDTEKPVESLGQIATTTQALAPAQPLALKADDGQPGPLTRLITRLSNAIGGLTEELQAGGLSIDDWEDQVSAALQQAYPAAYKAGAGGAASGAASTALAKQVKAQLSYLGRFALEIQAGDEWQAGWNSRAAMYAEGIKVPYWQGKTKMLPLPAMPGEGTTCLTRCKCSWDVQQLDGDGNYDAYWRRGASDSCQICVEREAQWSPLQVREGRLL